MKVTKSKLYKEVDSPVDSEGLPNYKQGYAEFEVILYEDSKEKYTGFFSGKLRTYFLIDDKEQFRYDAISFYSDAFSNNEFVGTWTSYSTKSTKRAHWGDWRIPESGDLDIGAGEFSVNEKYRKNGWENYMNSWHSRDAQEREKARQKEKEQWWR
jgi:hypothetical protein